MSETKARAPETPKPITGLASQPEPEPTATTTTATGPASDPGEAASHLLDIDTGEAPLPEDGGELAESPPALMSREDFFGLFKFAFSAPNMALAAAGRQPLHSLPIGPSDEAEARAASDAIYAIAEETSALRWMLAPDAPWLQRALPILIFAQLKASAVMGELKARRAKPVASPPLRDDAVPEGLFREAGTEQPVTDFPSAGLHEGGGDYAREVVASVH